MTGDDLCISTWAIHFALWPVNGIGRGQHSIAVVRLQSWILDELLRLLIPERVLGVRHMMRLRIHCLHLYKVAKWWNICHCSVFINHWSKLLDWPVSLYWRLKKNLFARDDGYKKMLVPSSEIILWSMASLTIKFTVTFCSKPSTFQSTSYLITANLAVILRFCV